jgi:hypothetical protein
MSISKEDNLIIIDAHTHAGGIDFYNFFIPRYPIAQSVRDLIFKMDCLDVDYAIVLPMPFPVYYDPRRVKDDKWISTGLEKFPYQLLNNALLYEIETGGYQSRLFPFLAIDPRKKTNEQIQFLEKNIQKGRIFGLKLHTLATGSSVQNLNESPFVHLLEEFDLPITVHSGSSNITSPLNALKFAEKHPKIRICIAHLAGFDRWTLKAALELDNVFLDTSGFLSLCEFIKQGKEKYVSKNRFKTNYTNPTEALIELSEYLKGKPM